MLLCQGLKETLHLYLRSDSDYSSFNILNTLLSDTDAFALFTKHLPLNQIQISFTDLTVNIA